MSSLIEKSNNSRIQMRNVPGCLHLCVVYLYSSIDIRRLGSGWVKNNTDITSVFQCLIRIVFGTFYPESIYGSIVCLKGDGIGCISCDGTSDSKGKVLV